MPPGTIKAPKVRAKRRNDEADGVVRRVGRPRQLCAMRVAVTDRKDRYQKEGNPFGRVPSERDRKTESDDG
jgi:hypothetical protein